MALDVSTTVGGVKVYRCFKKAVSRRKMHLRKAVLITSLATTTILLS